MEGIGAETNIALHQQTDQVHARSRVCSRVHARVCMCHSHALAQKHTCTRTNALTHMHNSPHARSSRRRDQHRAPPTVGPGSRLLEDAHRNKCTRAHPPSLPLSLPIVSSCFSRPPAQPWTLGRGNVLSLDGVELSGVARYRWLAWN
eukprot:3261511-Rhodomonas_salina.2